MFGKEKSGKVRCFGKTLTPTVFKRNEEIAAIKKQHSDEMTSVKREMEGLKFLVKSLLKQQNPNFDEGEVNGIMATALGNEKNATPHSSTSNHVPHREKVSFLLLSKLMHRIYIDDALSCDVIPIIQRNLKICAEVTMFLKRKKESAFIGMKSI